MINLSHAIQLVSIWGIIVPMVIGFTRFKTAEIEFRLFVLFLLVGFCTDITMYSLQNTSYNKYLAGILNVYSLVEACTFLWLIHKNSKRKFLLRVIKLLLLTTPLFWAIVVFAKPDFVNLSSSQLFDPFYEVIVAFLSCFVLLEIVERSGNINALPIFWLLFGIFFYCFSTFFIMESLNTFFSQEIWIVNNVINIITYIFYSIGLWKVGRSECD